MNPFAKEVMLTNSGQISTLDQTLNIDLPPDLAAGEPAEARGLKRDQVRLMVSHYLKNTFTHTRFDRLTEYLTPGDVLVINTSATLKAALVAWRQDGAQIELHLSSRLPTDLWVVELRQGPGKENEPLLFARAGEQLDLQDRGKVTLLVPYDPHLRVNSPKQPAVRLWIASLDLPLPVNEYLDRYGFPIRYKYVRENWPIEYYQTVYANTPGSAEMPSAGRAFTPELITRLVSAGITIAPLVLHTGVASLEAWERPYEEFYRLPQATADAINLARSKRRRVMAVGTTVARTIETCAGSDGKVFPGEGWTKLVITPERGLKTIDGMLTGFHEPDSTHLWILLALAGKKHITQAYRQAISQGYLWHEFGDLHLILP